MLVGESRVILDQARSHHQVPRNALGVLLAEGAQLLVHRTVQLLAGHALGDPWLRELGLLGSQPGTGGPAVGTAAGAAVATLASTCAAPLGTAAGTAATPSRGSVTSGAAAVATGPRRASGSAGGRSTPAR